VPDQDVDYQVAFNSSSLAPYHLVFFLPILQLLSYHRALLNGQNPDQPHNLSAVVLLNGENQS
jgi:fructoselysine-6-P-deglycase FrlB-like protein